MQQQTRECVIPVLYCTVVDKKGAISTSTRVYTDDVQIKADTYRYVANNNIVVCMKKKSILKLAGERPKEGN